MNTYQNLKKATEAARDASGLAPGCKEQLDAYSRLLSSARAFVDEEEEHRWLMRQIDQEEIEDGQPAVASAEEELCNGTNRIRSRFLQG